MTIEYTCDSGYSIKSGSNDTAMCNSEGEWNVPLPPICHPGKISCLLYIKLELILMDCSIVWKYLRKKF